MSWAESDGVPSGTYLDGTMTTVSPVLPVLPGSPAAPVDPVAPVAPVLPVAPVSPFGAASPVAPCGPAGPGTATRTGVGAAAGVTTVVLGLSHALSRSALESAATIIGYFMGLPSWVDCGMGDACVQWKVHTIVIGFRAPPLKGLTCALANRPDSDWLAILGRG